MKTVRQREALTPQREPHWTVLGNGKHVGFRRLEEGGTWIARWYDPATRKRSFHALTEVAHLQPGVQFEAAVKAAQAWFAEMERHGPQEALTVGAAFLRYVEHQRQRKGDAAADDVEMRYRRHVEHDPIAGIALSKLRAGHLNAWRERLSGKPTPPPRRGSRCRSKTPLPPPKARTATSVNRDMVALRAALNLAAEEGFAPDPMVWRRALKPTPGTTRRRDLYLDRGQRRALLANLAKDLAAFARALCLLPLRPGALAALTVADFDQRAGTLRISRDKAGQGRSILLPKQAADLIRQHAKGKHPAAPLFARWNSKAWDKDTWKGPIKDAVEAAGLPAGATLYTLRHSTITDLVGSNQVDLLTVAQISGTSARMIELHYGHLRADRARDALEGLAL